MRGHDLRDFMLLAFGGAGPVHAGRIARELGMAGMIVPLYPGVYSAIGLMMSDVKHDYIQSRMTPLSELTPQDVNAMFARLEAAATEDLHADGFAREADPHRARARHALCRPGLRDHHGLRRRAAARRRPRRAAQAVRRTAQGDVRPHRAGGAGRDRLLSRARHRPGAAGRDAEIQADRRDARRTRCAKRATCASTARTSIARSISARSSTSGLTFDGPGHSRSVRLHHRDLPRPDRAGG